jgi:hypothetical protein
MSVSARNFKMAVGLVGVMSFSGLASASATFEYRLDRFSVGSYVHDFNNLNGWWKQWGTVTASNGYAVFTDPGQEVVRSGVDATFYVSNLIRLSPQASVDFTAETKWSSAYLPEAPGGFFGQYFREGNVMYTINISNYSQAVADTIADGAIAGLAMSFAKVDMDGNALDVQTQSISAGSFSGDLIMRLIFDKSLGQMSATYSLDGGSTFDTPFYSLAATGAGTHILVGDPVAVSAVPVPGAFLLFGSALAGMAGLRARTKGAGGIKF